MKMKSLVARKMISVCVLAALLTTMFPFLTKAEENNTEPQIQFVTKLSKKEIKKGDTVTVSVHIENYKDSVKKIDAFKVTVPVDEDYFEFVKANADTDSTDPAYDASRPWKNSIAIGFSTGTTSDAGRTILQKYSQEGNVEVSFADAFVPLEKDTDQVFSFELRAREDLTEDNRGAIGCTAMVMLGGDSDKVEAVTKSADYLIMSTDSEVLFNGVENTEGAVYNDSVEIKVDKGTAVITDEEGIQIAEVTADSPYTIKKNGVYKVSIASIEGTGFIEKTFTISLPVASIAVETEPLLTDYIETVQDILDVTGGTIKITYANGFEEVIDITKEMCTGYDLSKPGTTKVTVSYEGKTAQYEVSISEKVPVSIQMHHWPNKTVYKQGDTIDLTGVSLLVTYNNETTAVVDAGSGIAVQADMNTPGQQKVILKYGDCTTEFTITINAVETEGEETTKDGQSGMDNRDKTDNQAETNDKSDADTVTNEQGISDNETAVTTNADAKTSGSIKSGTTGDKRPVVGLTVLLLCAGVSCLIGARGIGTSMDETR